MSDTPSSYEPISYNQRKNKGCASDVIMPILFGTLGVASVAALFYVLFSGRYRRRCHKPHTSTTWANAAHQAPAQAQIAQQTEEVQNEPQMMIKKEEYDFNTIVDNLAGVTAMDDSDELADIHSAPTTGGIMNQPETAEKKFNVDKMMPTMGARKSGTLADQFAPSGAELAAFLPTVQDMHREQPNGPKFFRTKTPRFTDDGFGPAMIPENFKEITDGMRSDRPRINEKAMREQVKAQQEHFSRTRQ